MIDYDDRLKNLGSYRAVISATLSPHFTIRQEDLSGKTFSSAVWIDMAVPRDIDEKIGEIPGISFIIWTAWETLIQRKIERR